MQKVVPPQSVPGAKELIGMKRRRDLWPDVFRNGSIECRMRASGAPNGCGELLKWYFINGSYFVDKAEVERWLDGCAITSSAQLPANTHGNRFQHLPAARAKAAEARRAKSAAAAQ